MPILSLPFIADPLARLFAVPAGGTTPARQLQFAEIPGRTRTTMIPTRHGQVPATIYHPPDAENRPPVYLNVHGGEFVVGRPEQDDPWCRYLAAHAKVVVVNPDYALAPRHRFPVAVEQIYDVLAWVASPDRHWDNTRVCIGGQSAGGNLSAAAARLALESGGPQLELQVLHYAPLDLVTRAKHKCTPAGRKAVFKPWMGDILDTAYIPDPVRGAIALHHRPGARTPSTSAVSRPCSS